VSVSAYITKRETKTGARFVVRYRRGGRGFSVEHAGSFKTLRDARLRRDFVAGELAAGRDPREALARQETPRRTLREWAEVYRASRIDFAAETRKNMESHFRRLLPSLGERYPDELVPADVREWVARNADLKPSSLARYIATLRQLLDFIGVDPNPARDSHVKLPQIVHEEPTPPSAEHVLAMLRLVAPRQVLPLVVLEQTAMRVGELEDLGWGDVDVPGSRFRLRSSETKSRRARWVQVPAWLMAELEQTCPREDRTPERRVFQGFNADVAKNAMARACRTAGIPHFHPHDLRHRRTSLWHGQGVPEKELSQRVGHARASMTLDVYSHVMPLDEVSQEQFEAVLVRSR
jgi:integrase